MRVILPILCAALGIAVGFLWARRGRTRSTPPTAASEGHPALDWLLRANGALGAWLVSPGFREVASPRDGIPKPLNDAVLQRLDHHRLEDGQKVERLEAGTLVMACRDGQAAALLLDGGVATGGRAAALRDLARFLDLERVRPITGEMATPDEEGRGSESIESVAYRLAHQVERNIGAEVWVVLNREGVAVVAGLSNRSDKRLLGVAAERGSALEQIAVGQEPPREGVASPLGQVVADRRQRRDAAFVCPIVAERKTVGALAVWSEDGREPGGGELLRFRKALEEAGPRFAAAFERQALLDQARKDPLTGLLNRRGLDAAMSSVSAGFGALVYADLDLFKALNDRLGHPAGDAALVHVARLLSQAIRDGDAAARIGGEEFALWLPGAPLERGRQVAERVRQSLSYSDFKWQGEPVRITASFGVAACPETTAARQNLPAQADAALYNAKHLGRNRVEVARKA